MTSNALLSVSEDSEPSLLRYAVQADDPVSLAIAGTIGTAVAHRLPSALWLRGLDADECAEMLDALFPGSGDHAQRPQPDPARAADALDPEFDDLFKLLLEAAHPPTRESRWLASAVASACLFDNHLWQDLRLPNRVALSELLRDRFPSLAARNRGNMRWKAFFYKQLCERAGMVCRAPSCGACDDYDDCFGPE